MPVEILGVDLRFSEEREPEFALLQNQPNPFRDRTRIEFVLPEAGEVELIIFDNQGRRAYEARENFAAGETTVLARKRIAGRQRALLLPDSVQWPGGDQEDVINGLRAIFVLQ